ncbi:MAG: sigma 54-interacting transcriptional regulator [Planctomycetes bacterium]|nr:sigma 54-interacting transcriptional regulator [Planctomycetota bacterium]
MDPVFPADLAARFDVERGITGGEGQTFMVSERGTGERLVLKLLDGAADLGEASLLTSLRHPRIPLVREVGRAADGRAYVLRTLAPGRPLGDLAPLAAAELLPIATELCELLAFVHLRGILHLDVKPANVLVADETAGSERVWLIDFGFGLRGARSSASGTPFFAAPELLLGAAVDARTDLFALGATFVAMLVPDLRARVPGFFLRFPREGFLPALGLAQEDLPPPFDRIVPRLVERRPERRFADAQELLEALRGRAGRASRAAIALDPVAAHGRALDEELAKLEAGDDLALAGLTHEDRDALALHVACVLGDVRAIVHAGDSVTLTRGGARVRRVALRPLDGAELARHAGACFGLDADAAIAVAELLRAHGATSAARATSLLEALVDAGAIRPDGASWTWPDAAAGRAAWPADDDATSTAIDPATILALASRGRVEAAQRTAKRALEAGHASDVEVRAALAQGLLLAGEALRALPFTHDLPLLRARALLESGDVLGAAARLAEVPAGTDEAALRRLRAGLRYHEGRYADGLAELASRACPAPEDRVLRGALLAALARHDDARAELDAALAELPAATQPFVRAAALAARGELARRRGDLAAAREDQQEALALCRSVGNAHAAASASLNLGVVAKDLGDRIAAREHLRRARALFHHVGDRARELTADANLGIVLLADGDAFGARERFDVAIDGLSACGATQAVPLVRAFRAQASAALGDVARAQADLGAIEASADRRVQDEAARAVALLAAVPASARVSALPTAMPVPMTSPLDSTMDGVPSAVFRTFLAVNRRLASERDLEKAMNSLLEAAETVTGARASYLLVERGSGLRLELASRQSTGLDKSFSRSLANKALSAQRTMSAEDALTDRDLMNMPSVRALNVRSALCVPFRAASGVAGALYVEHSGRAGAFGPREAEMLEALADQAAIAVERMLREEHLASQLEHSRRDLQVVQRKLSRVKRTELLGKSPVMAELRRHIERFAQSDLAVLVYGETGTGKELVARALHDASPRARGPFVSENCSAIPADLMESELFGHQKGAFTGADEDRSGLLELANGGTLFLDEVGDMPPGMQVKLLRALQERSIRRVGGREAIPIDVRLVSATHKDLLAMVKAGEFREDLYFRIAAGTIRVPALRERGDDIELLARNFVERHGQEQRRAVTIDDASIARLRKGRWPGNVRELEHVIARAFLLTEGDVLKLDDADAAPASAGEVAATAARWPAIPLNEAIYRTLYAALRTTGGDKSAAAKLLRISRTALYEKLRRESVDRPEAGSFEER